MALTSCLRSSVIVSTFERPDALAIVLESVRVAALRMPHLEVVVADDGSGPQTREVVERFAALAPFPVSHARHEHRGFRLAAIRNRAARLAQGEVLVFLDGDCLLFPGSLALHAARAAPGRAHTGARVFLGPKETGDVLSGALPAGEAMQAARRRARGKLWLLFGSNLLYRALRLKPRPKLGAANCAVYRRDFERVNGFDERFVGWGYEDDDLARRLRRSGTRILDGTLDCLALHLFHPVHPSHRPSARGTANHLYFHRGGFLTSCRRGLKERPLDSLRFEVLGSPSASLEAVLGKPCDASPVEDNAREVTLVFSGTRDPARAGGKLVVPIPPEVEAAGPAALRAFLEEAL